MDARGFPTSLPEFQQVFPNDAACAKYLETMRWPDGFTCPKCRQTGKPYRFPTRSSVVLRCRSCKVNTSLTASTVMQATHTPLSTWFWGAYLVTTQTPGQSALQFQRQLGLTRYETAFQILHKLRAGMVRPERDAIGGEYPVEVDECFIGGVHNKAVVIGAVEVRLRKDAENRAAKYKQAHDGGVPLKQLVYAGRLRLRVIPGRSAGDFLDFINENVTKSSTVRTDAARGYESLPGYGYVHAPLKIGGDPEKAQGHLPMIHLVFSNVKTWILGTHHGRIEAQHLQAYLNEYVFRFNRRFYPMTAFNSVLGLAAHSASPTYAELYSGAWRHPAA
jgi:hypothetical protein